MFVRGRVVLEILMFHLDFVDFWLCSLRLHIGARDFVNESPSNNVVVFIQLQMHELVNDVFSNLRAAAEANTLLGNDYIVDVNSVTLRDRKSR